MHRNILSQRPSLKLKLKINKSTITSFQVLQMSIAELHEFSKKEIEKNPIITMPSNYRKNFNDKSIEQYAENSNIKSWLYQQSYTLFDNENNKLIKTFIENLDDNGFCLISPLEVAELNNTSLKNATKILNKLKTLDPIGIFSESLEENLKIQLKKMGVFNNKYDTVLKNLELLASYNIKKLMQLCTIEENDIRLIIKNIKSLNPRPIDSFSPETVNTAIPDIIVKKNIKNNKLVISINKNQSLKVTIDKEYVKEMKNKSNGDKTKIYLRKCMTHAKWLESTLNRRYRTIVIVSSKILNHQKDYFFKSTEEMLPLTLKQVGSMCGLHETTIGRTVKNKFILYENNTFSLKAFFNSKIKKSSSKNNISSLSIKFKLKKIINAEENNKIIYSDQKLVELFFKNGIIISRRTIAKYRESLNIPSSIVRSRQINF